jgi:hypothetical protein
MAGLVGVIAHDRRQPLPGDEFAALVGAYRALRGDGHVERESAGTWAHVAQIDGDVPGTARAADGSWLLSAGAIHADGDLLAAPNDGLDGQFAAIRYDAAGERLSIVADPFGMQALYASERDGRTYVSTSAVALARHLRSRPDDLGMALFLRAGYQFGPLTHWEGIERLDPGTAITFAGDGPRRQTYWLPEVDERVRAMSLRETTDHCVDVALSTIGRRLGPAPEVWADLTGGFDSRLITAALRRVGVPFRTATSGGATDPDVVLAREVARVAGFDWRHDRMPDDWTPGDDTLATAVAWGDGTLEVLQLGEVLWRHRRKAGACRTVVTGGGGEHVSARPWVQEFLRAGRSGRVRMDNLLRMRYLHPVDQSMLRRDRGAEVEGYFRTVLGARANLYAGEPNTTKLDAIYAYKSTGHFGAYRSASEAFVRQEIPFYYRDVFTACFSAHHRWRNGHRLQRAMIERLDPAVARVPTTLGGPAQTMRAGNAHRFAPYYARAARAAARKLSRRDGAKAGSPPPHDAAVARLRAAGVLDPRSMRSGHLYDPAALRSLLGDARRVGSGGSPLPGRVVTLELLLRAADASEPPVPRGLVGAEA